MAIILLLAVSLIYGLYYLAIEVLLESGWQSHWMNSTRFLIGGLTLALVAVACRQGPELVRLHRQELPPSPLGFLGRCGDGDSAADTRAAVR